MSVFIDNQKVAKLKNGESTQIEVPARNGIFPKVNFDKIGKEMLNNITGDYIKEKYKIEDGIQIKHRLREERIKYLKNMINSTNLIINNSNEQ